MQYEVMRQISIGLLLVLWVLILPLRASVIDPIIESWGIDGSNAPYLAGSQITVEVSIEATRTNPNQDNMQPVSIYFSSVQNSTASPAVYLGTLTADIPANNVGGGPIVTGTYNIPTKFNGIPIPAGNYYIVFYANASGGSSIESTQLTIAVPQIELQQPLGNNLTNGSSTVSFGDTGVGGNTTRTFVISNPGTGTLTNISATIKGANAGDFSFVTMPPASLGANGSANFIVQFTPSAVGSRLASLSIASSVAGSNNPFVVALTGTGDAVPDAPVPTLPPWGNVLLAGLLVISGLRYGVSSSRAS